jgi:rhodanese-related sulfurtransferase
VLVFSQPGALPAAALQQVIDTVTSLDMAQVAAQVAAQRALLGKPREISLEDFASAQAGGAVVIDVREPGEYRAGHVPAAVLIPLGRLAEKLAEVPTEGPVHVICASGNRSLHATDVLRSHGVEAYSVAGGTSAWQRSGREVVTGPLATASTE